MAADSPFHDYRLFGLRVRSRLDLPDLQPAKWSGPPDVTVEVAPIETEDCVSGSANTDEEFGLNIEGVARYRMRAGSTIIVDPDPAGDPRSIRLFLTGSVFGAILHQRGILPLHASCVQIDGRGIAIVGASGAGKSTLAAWFNDHGFRIFADDVAACRFVDDRVFVHQGIPRLRLWHDALKNSGRREAAFERSFPSDPDFRKFDVPVAAGGRQHEVELVAIFELTQAVEIGFTAVDGSDAVRSIMLNTYRDEFIGAESILQSHWENCVRLARTVPVFRFARPRDLAVVGDGAQAILNFLDERDLGR